MEDVELLMSTAPAIPEMETDEDHYTASDEVPRKSSSSSACVKNAAASSSTATTTTTPSDKQQQRQQPVEVALAFWSQLDLPGARREELERQSRELKEAKDNTIKNRKRLAERTKEWKKKGNNNNNASGGGPEELLKAYQEEIDNLTRRAKGADAAFAAVYQALRDAPDPTPLLSAAVQERKKSAALELELTRLHGEVEEYEAEFRTLKNQEVTIRRLEETVAAYEQGAAGDVAEAIESAREEIEALADARVREALEREERLEARLRLAQEVQANAEAGLARAQAEVFEVTRKAEENAAALRAECELLAQERERHETEAAAARRELEVLLTADSSNSSSSSSSSPVPSSSLGAGGSSSRVQALQAELDEMGTSLAAVRQRLLAKEEEWAQVQGRVQEKVVQLKKELEEEKAAKAQVEEEMRARPSPEEVMKLRSQVRMLQQLEFNGAEEEEEGGKQGGGTKHELVDVNKEEGEEEGTPSVEHMLMQRLRKMETEVMTSRRKVAELEGDKATLDQAKHTLEANLHAQAILVAQLEEDLARLTVPSSSTSSSSQKQQQQQQQQQQRQEQANEKDAMIFISGASLSSPSVREQQGSGDGTSLEIDMHQLLTTAAHVVPSSSSSSSSSSSATQPMDLVHILQAQRDRYKGRVRELEGELAHAGKAAEKAKLQAEAMQRDNVTLYEKIRFLQSYGGGGGGGKGSPGRGPAADKASSTGPSSLRQQQQQHQDAVMEAGLVPAATEARYRAIYEENMNPFKAFNAAERVRKYQDLGIVDKITLQTTRAFLASKAARSFVFFYVVAMHALVFLTLYAWGHHHCADLHYHGESLSIPPDSLHPLGMGGGGGGRR